MSGPEQSELSQLAAEAIGALKQRGMSVATVEATTGGLIGHLLVSVPGSSGVFRAGVAPYSNDAKQKLGVTKDILDQYGAVSGEAAEALAQAVRDWLFADVGVGETGIAGPTGGSDERQVGTFWIAVVHGGKISVKQFEFEGDREGNLRYCARAALRMLVEGVKA